YVQSAGIHHDMEVDGFMVAVAAELGIDISGHRARSFDDMEDWGEDIDAYDQIIALSPAAQRRALEYTRDFHVDVIYWPTLDPTGIGERREDRLEAYRQTRDQLIQRIKGQFPV
ncbi:MAG: low molecular weight phosphatase family protein, partial [Pseudomonadota bacterium]